MKGSAKVSIAKAAGERIADLSFPVFLQRRDSRAPSSSLPMFLFSWKDLEAGRRDETWASPSRPGNPGIARAPA